MKKRICIFASGSGTNAENLIRYYRKSLIGEVVQVFCNKSNAGVIERAKQLQVPVFLFEKEELYTSEKVDSALQDIAPDLIVLAGFLLQFPIRILNQYPNRVVNIHPALLPKYGGKGMYGDHVHRAVLANHEKVHGVTVHLVNEEYDKGEILLQESFPIGPNATLEAILTEIHRIEFRIFPLAIDSLLQDLK